MPFQAYSVVSSVFDAGPDPKQPVLKLVGVYPVVDGYAQLNLQDVLGNAQTGDEALHAFPGDPLPEHFIPTRIAGHACRLWRPQLSFGLHQSTRPFCIRCKDSDMSFSLCCAGSLLNKLFGWPLSRAVE